MGLVERVSVRKTLTGAAWAGKCCTSPRSLDGRCSYGLHILHVKEIGIE